MIHRPILQILEARYPVGYGVDRGNHWISRRLLPALRRQRVNPWSNSEDRSEVAIAWMVVGDVYSVVDAPRHAIAAFREAADLDTDQYVQAQLEIANEYAAKLGQRQRAAEILDRVQAIRAEDALDEQELQTWNWVQSELHDPHRLPARLSTFSDHLVAGEFMEAELIALRETNPVKRQFLMARLAGAQGDAESMFGIWQAIFQSEPLADLRNEDWFFAPKELVEDPDLWRFLVAHHKQIASTHTNLYRFPDDLSRLIPNRDRGSKDNQRQSWQRCFSLWSRYHLARLTGDARLATLLAAEYPLSRRLSALAIRLSSRSSFDRDW
jgi:tetratricopeptide (TPR) repeat protein